MQKATDFSNAHNSYFVRRLLALVTAVVHFTLTNDDVPSTNSD